MGEGVGILLIHISKWSPAVTKFFPIRNRGLEKFGSAVKDSQFLWKHNEINAMVLILKICFIHLFGTFVHN